jgi:anhydro-N-acetylmuramic acid kinase
VVLNCRRFSTLEKTLNVIVSGGGVHHKTVMKLLTQQFSPVEVTSSVHFNVDPDVKEALGFAILGAAYLKSVPGNLPSVTGASHPVVLGKLTL